MPRKHATGFHTPRFRRGTKPPRPIVGLDRIVYHQDPDGQGWTGDPRIKTVPRPCLVDGRPAFFHRWVDEDKALLKVETFCSPDEIDKSFARFYRDGLIDHSCDIEKLHTFSALVEYEGGTVAKVNPELIRFTDREDTDQ